MVFFCTMNPVIQTNGLCVYRERGAVLVNVDFHAQAGEFVSIVGVSGAGKSTLLHALAGHLPCTGRVVVPNRIGMVFQHHAVFPWMTVEQNISFGLGEGAKETVQSLLAVAGLESKADAYPVSLSGGERQRVAVARAVAHAPDVLLMDEPFGSLDAHTREHMQEWLREVCADRGTTVVLVTHDIEEALVLSDRIIILADGRMKRTFDGFRSALWADNMRYSDRLVRFRHEIAGCLAS